MYSNVQSFLSKKKEIEEYIADKKFALIFFTEVWLTKEHNTVEFHLPGFQSPAVDFKARGGTMIFVRENVPFYEVSPPPKNAANPRGWSCILKTERKDYTVASIGLQTVPGRTMKNCSKTYPGPVQTLAK